MKKVILISIGVLVLLGAVAVFFLVRNLDALVAAAIETYGTRAAGTPVRTQGVEIGLQAGRGSVRTLTVANPADFSNQPAFSLGNITVDLDTASLTREVPVIEEIRVQDPSFRLEVGAAGKTNLAVIRDHLRQFSAGGGKDKGEATGSAGEPRRLQVKKIVIEGGKGILDLTAVGGQKREAELPPITLTNLGGAGGITPGALGEAVLAALIKAAQESAARQGVEQAIREKLGEKAGEIEKKLEEQLGPGAGEQLKKMLGQ